MSIFKKYISPIIIFFIVYMFGTLAVSLGISIAEYGYDLLCRMFQDTFTSYNPIRHPKEMLIYERWIFIAGGAVGLFIINAIATRADNAKYEFLTKRTDGCYRIKEALRIYLDEFMVSDIIASVAFPALLVLSAYFVPEEFLDKLYTLPLWLGAAMRNNFKMIPAIFIIVLMSLISKFAAILSSLRAWRGMWLIGSISG